MKHVNVVCALIKNKEGNIFCCQRGPGRAMEGYWEFPGGKIEPNESKEHAIVREIKEELNSIIKPVKYLGVVNHTYTDIENPFSITMYGYLCTLEEGTLELSEHIDKKWCNKEELAALNFAAADIPFIEFIK